MSESQKSQLYLTMLLPVKDRPEYTMRLLEYLEVAEFRGKIFIADGSIEEATFKAISQFLSKSNLTIVYKRYQPDHDYSAFLNKMLDALQLIDTPYAVIAADDDFYSCDLLYAAVDFLESNQNYSAWCGETIDFRVQPNVRLKMPPKFVSGVLSVGMRDRYCAGRYKRMHSISSESVKTRLSSFPIIHPYEAVHRTTNLKTAFNIAKDARIYNYRFLDRIFRYLVLLAGQFHYSDEAFLLRQSNTDSHEGMDLITRRNPSDLHFVMSGTFMTCLRDIDREITKFVKFNDFGVSTSWIEAHLANSSLDFLEAVFRSNRKWLIGEGSGIKNYKDVVLDVILRNGQDLFQRLPYCAPHFRIKQEIRGGLPNSDSIKFINGLTSTGRLSPNFISLVIRQLQSN
jgi:glycosyltransferase domain-containing protein